MKIIQSRNLIRHTLLTVLVISTVFESNSQTWKLSSFKSEFDGDVKSSSIIGTGGKFPFTKPLIVVNTINDNNLNIYFNDVGYAGCKNKIAYLKFDNSDSIYNFFVTTNNARDVWFLDLWTPAYGTNINVIWLLKKIKVHKKLYVRLASDCDVNTYTFSLTGSTKAIDFATNNYLSKYWEKRKKTENRELQNNTPENNTYISEETKAKNEILVKPTKYARVLIPTSLYNKSGSYYPTNNVLKRGIDIQIIDFSDSSNYYVFMTDEYQKLDFSLKYILKNDIIVFNSKDDINHYNQKLESQLNKTRRGFVLKDVFPDASPDPKDYWGYSSLKRNDEIIVTDYDLESDFYILSKSERIKFLKSEKVYVLKDYVKITDEEIINLDD